MAAIPTPPAEAPLKDSAVISVSIGPGGAKWECVSTNTEGVTTELMIQRIPSEVALPSKEYKTQGFYAFETVGDYVTLPLAPGWWSFGYQKVEIATGRVTGFMRLGTHLVSLSVVQGGADSAPAAKAKDAAKKAA